MAVVGGHLEAVEKSTLEVNGSRTPLPGYVSLERGKSQVPQGGCVITELSSYRVP